MGRGRSRLRLRAQPILPSSQLSITTGPSSGVLSYWYCDYKVFALNGFLFDVGRLYSRFLQVWFSLGVYCTIICLAVVSMLLLWDTLGLFHFHSRSSVLGNVLNFDRHISLVDAGNMIFSTMVSVLFHEFGHAIAAASEGLQVEYIAIFMAFLFPGALVALNIDHLENLPYYATLRIYCAGIWHNLTLCAICALTIFFLPAVLHPLYLKGAGLSVLWVAHNSPFSGHLSTYDVITAVGDSRVTDSENWVENYHLTHANHGYCVPRSWLEASNILWEVNSQASCPEELMAFQRVHCVSWNHSASSTGTIESNVGDKYCLISKDVVKLKKCGDHLRLHEPGRDRCLCFEGESCLAPIQTLDMSWLEITYESPFSPECTKVKRNASSEIAEDLNRNENLCGGTFVFLGNLRFAASSVQLSSYRPRWHCIAWSLFIPQMLEKFLTCLLKVSACVGLINCIPAYFLDGDSILDTILSSITWFPRQQQRRVLRVCVTAGTVLLILELTRILFSTLFPP